MAKKIGWWRETKKEVSVVSKNILNLKDVFLAAQFVAIVIGACSHFKTCTQLKETQKQSYKYKEQRDSLKVENINLKY